MTSSELDTLLENLDKLRTYKFASATEQRSAMRKVQSVAADLQQPFDRILEMWGSPIRDAAVKIGADVGLFDQLGGRDEAKSLEEVTKAVHVDPRLLRGLLVHLVACHIINEAGPNQYYHSAYSEALKTPSYQGCIAHQFDSIAPTFLRFPQFVKTHGYKIPEDGAVNGFGFAHAYSGTWFDYMTKRNVEGSKAWDQFFPIYPGYVGSWTEVYPLSRLLQGAKDGQVVFVDVAGGLGHDLRLASTALPDCSRDRLVLQELEGVVNGARAMDENRGFEITVHDFFKPQPVMGARAYHLHHVLHDWPDEKGVEILQALRPALGPDSKILINEMIMPDQGALPYYTMHNLLMMSLYGARERTAAEFTSMIERAGLKVGKVWTSESCLEGILEVGLP